MIRIIKYKIDDPNDQVMIKYFLKSKGYSSLIISLLKRVPDGILVNGNYVYVTHKLKIGDVLKVTILDEKPSEKIVKKDIPLNIVYEDEDVLVLDKQAGVTVHPSCGHFENSIANGVMNYYGDDFVFRCINRLDRDTTGLMIVAKNRLSGGILSSMVKVHDIKRQYLAICKGDFPFDEGKIDAPIARTIDSAIERSVDFERGDRAVTNHKKVMHKNGYSLINLRLETGRTHQIRVHMQYIGYPLIGDFLYNPDFDVINRQALHSWKLEFTHPITGENLSFISELPIDMSQIFE